MVTPRIDSLEVDSCCDDSGLLILTGNRLVVVDCGGCGDGCG